MCYYVFLKIPCFYNENLRVVISFLSPVNESRKAVKDSPVVRALNAKYLKSTCYINQLKALVIQQDLYRSRQLSYLNLALFFDTLYKNILFAVIPREPNITHG